MACMSCLVYRLKYYLNLLKDPKKFGEIKKCTAYEHDSIPAAMEMSLNALDENIRSLYIKLAVFNGSLGIPLSVRAYLHKKVLHGCIFSTES